VEAGLYPAAHRLIVVEFFEGQTIETYHSLDFAERTWYRLRVEANSKSGRIDIYVDDTFLASHKPESLRRAGLSGLFGGNSGGNFDNYTLRGRMP
jgi:hypothetical protein